MITPKEFCKIHNACWTGFGYAEKFSTLQEAWDNCPRGDWMLWYLKKAQVAVPEFFWIEVACWCARNTPLGDGRTTWDLLTDERSRKGIETAEAYTKGLATFQEVDAAADAAACAARAARAAADAAAFGAARAAAYAAADAAYVAYVAAFGAAHRAHAAADAAADKKAQADYIRSKFNPFQ